MTIYTLNQELNGIEIKFDSKPGEITRDELKKAGFRWHKVKKVWYAKQSAERLELAEKLASREAIAAQIGEEEKPEALEIPDAIRIDDGLYSGWQGGNNKAWHSNKELKALLLADFKRAGIAATIRFNRAGYLTSITVTIKISADEIKPYDEWKEGFHVVAGHWAYYKDEAGELRSIYGENFYSLPEDEQAELFENIRRTSYELEITRLTESGSTHNSDEDVLTEAVNKKFSTVRAIVGSYNRDQSNSMVDYFDRDIYDHYTFKIA